MGDEGEGRRRRSSASFAPPRRDSVTISFEGRDYLAAHDVRVALEQGAQNAIANCLVIGRGDDVVLVVESGYEEVGAALLKAAEDRDARVAAFIVRDEQARNDPFVTRLAGRVAEASASVFVGGHATMPVAFRKRLATAGGGTRRHADMAGVTPRAFEQSMRTDPREIDAVGDAIGAALSKSTEVVVETSLGTRLRIKTDPKCPWHHARAVVPVGGWSFLPAGEVVATPASVDGTLVADGGIFLADGTEHARSARIRLKLADGVLKDVEGLDPGDRLLELIDACGPHARRVGRVGFGTNTGVLAPVGELTQDRRAPGFHLTLGATWSELTGADWDGPSEVSCLVRRADAATPVAGILLRGRPSRELS